MSLEYEKISGILAEYPDLADFTGGASDENIERAETYLGIRFPNSYREFLRKWGTLSFGPIEYFGLLGNDFENAGVPDAVWYTHRLRAEIQLPKHLVVIVDNDGDEYYCLDTSRLDIAGECPVVVWDCPTAEISRTKGTDFATFLSQHISDFLE